MKKRAALKGTRLTIWSRAEREVHARHHHLTPENSAEMPPTASDIQTEDAMHLDV
jgi:hypothetical protein